MHKDQGQYLTLIDQLIRTRYHSFLEFEGYRKKRLKPGLCKV